MERNKEGMRERVRAGGMEEDSGGGVRREEGNHECRRNEET